MSTEHFVAGRKWTLLGEEPYTRRDGTPTKVLVWQSLCRACGAPFEIRTPARYETSKAFGAVNCPEHRGSTVWDLV